jgi:4-hydroxy-4-methyl-2-oxoglutarate aldolase
MEIPTGNSVSDPGPQASGNGFRELPPELLDYIREFDTCTIANAIELFQVRLKNEGFTRPGLKCLTGGNPRILGFAATCRVRSADPPMSGPAFRERTDWWAAIQTLPTPRIAVVQDIDGDYSWGSVLGEVHAAILQAFGCEGVATNGTVRDVPGLAGRNFPVFARAAAVSHAYTHVVDFGNPVEIFGLQVRSGDLLMADVHGLASIPLNIAAALPDAARRIREHDRRIIEICESPDFSPEKLIDVIQQID